MQPSLQLFTAGWWNVRAWTGHFFGGIAVVSGSTSRFNPRRSIFPWSIAVIRRVHWSGIRSMSVDIEINGLTNRCRCCLENCPNCLDISATSTESSISIGCGNSNAQPDPLAVNCVLTINTNRFWRTQKWLE